MADENGIDLVFPTVHLNGTARQDLLYQFADASIAIQSAIKALEAAYPNGRDYYTQGPDALRKAEKQAKERIERFASVLGEIALLMEHIADAP